MPPPPLPMTTPALRLGDAQPGVGPRLARGDDADQRRARVALRIGAVARDPRCRRRRAPGRRRWSTPGTGAATRQANPEASNSVIARVPLQPRLTCSQKRSRPTPNGDTTPMPVMTTRGGRVSMTHELILSDRYGEPVNHTQSHPSRCPRPWSACSSGSAAACSSARWRYCAWWYTVCAVGGRGRSRRLVGAVAIDALLFGVFALHHSVFARERGQGAAGARRPRAPAAVGLRLDRQPAADRWCACSVAPIGGERLPRHRWLARIRHRGRPAARRLADRRSRCAAIDRARAGRHPSRSRRAAALQVARPVPLVRHPLYLGWIWSSSAPPHMTGDRLAFAAITTLYLVVAIPWEERSLRAELRRATTRATRAQVRWRIIPFIY